MYLGLSRCAASLCGTHAHRGEASVPSLCFISLSMVHKLPGEKGVCHTAPYKRDLIFAGDFHYPCCMFSRKCLIFISRSLCVLLCINLKIKSIKAFFKNKLSPKPWRSKADDVKRRVLNSIVRGKHFIYQMDAL